MPLIHLIKDDTHINFMGARFMAFGLSLFLIIASLFFLGTRGLNFGIDFTGGTLVEIKTNGPADISDLRSRFADLDLGSVSIQEFGAEDEILIRIPEQANAAEEGQAALMDTVRGALGDAVLEYRRVEYVGPQVGDELIRTGLQAVIFSLLGIMLYIWIRFEWPFGVAAVGALIHDTIITMGFFAVTQIEFGLSTVAAVLMIAGYSINDTVVVFDRVRENLRKFKRQSLIDLFNNSINQMLSRSIMTSLTTLLALFALWFFGGEVIRAFVITLIFGIVVGTYSSVYIATPLLKYIRPDILRPDMDQVEAAA